MVSNLCQRNIEIETVHRKLLYQYFFQLLYQVSLFLLSFLSIV